MKSSAGGLEMALIRFTMKSREPGPLRILASRLVRALGLFTIKRCEMSVRNGHVLNGLHVEAAVRGRSIAVANKTPIANGTKCKLTVSIV